PGCLDAKTLVVLRASRAFRKASHLPDRSPIARLPRPTPEVRSKMAPKVLRTLTATAAALVTLLLSTSARASELDLTLPDFSTVQFLGTSGARLLSFGLGVCALGLVFGLVIYQQLKKLPVHRSM